MNMIIRDILTLEKVSESKLLAGVSGCYRSVTSVNIMDAPDIIDWIQQNELVITSGYFLRDSIIFQEKFIQELYDKGCAGLGIKLKRYVDIVPDEVIDLANKLEFPIIELPYDYSLSEILNTIIREIFNKQAAMLDRSQKIQNLLTETALKGEGLIQLCNVVADIIKNPIIIIDDEYKLIANTQNEFAFVDKLLKSGHFKYNQPLHLFKDVIIEEDHEDRFEKNITIENVAIHCLHAPVRAVKDITGYIIVLQTHKRIEESDLPAIDHAVTITALELMKRNAIKQTRLRYKADFLDDLLSDKFDYQASKELGQIHGLSLKTKYACICINIKNLEKMRLDKFDDEKERLSNTIKRIENLTAAIAQETPDKYHIVTFIRGNALICFLETKNTEREIELKRRAKDLCDNIVAEIKTEFSDINLIVGIGKSQAVNGLHASYKMALQAIEYGELIAKRGQVFHIDDFKVYNFLQSFSDSKVLNSFYEKNISELIRYDEDNDSKLEETLTCFFEHKGNVTAASKALFIHRNTFMYRLEKIKSILEINLHDADELFSIQLALKVKNILRIK